MGSGLSCWPHSSGTHTLCKFQSQGLNGGTYLITTQRVAPRPSYCNSSRHQRYSLKDLLLASGHKGHYHRVSQPRAMPCPLHPATSSSKRTTVCITEDRTTVPEYQGTHCPRKSYYTYLHLHNHSALGPWPTHGRNVWLRSPHSPQCPARLNTVTGVAIQELPRTETRPISFGPCQRSTRSLQLLQYTGHSGISPTPRAAMARASDLTWGSDQKPQKLLCFGFQSPLPQRAQLAALTGRNTPFPVKSSRAQPGSTVTPATTGQAECLYAPQCLYMDLAFQEPLQRLYTAHPQTGASQMVVT